VTERSVRSKQRWTLVATILASSMTFIDGTVVNVALPALQKDLGATITDVQWVIVAYALFLGALILIGGSLGDQLGRKRIFLIGVVWFTAASIWCGIAPSSLVLIIGRGLQGVGAALLVPGSLAIISAAFDASDRGRAIGTWSGFSAITTAIGPVLGGWLIENFSWRAAFFINAPLAVIVVWISVRYMDESSDPSRARRVDWLGAALAVIGLGGIVLGLLEWPAMGATRPLVIGSVVVGVIGLAGFLLVERREKNPMMPLHLFASRTFTLTNVLTLLLYGALGIGFFIVPLLLIQVEGYTATAAGAAFLPFPIIMFALSRWSGGLVGRVGPRMPLTVGPLIAASGFALFARAEVGSSYWSAIFPAVVVLGLGMAITVAPLTTTVMTSVPSDHAGVASGINNAVARVAGLLAIALFGVVLTREFNASIEPQLERSALSREVRGQIANELPKMAGADLSKISLDQQQKTAIQTEVRAAFLHGFKIVMLEAAAVTLLSAFAGLGVSPREVRSSPPSRGGR
jgi:EmrB/QacA subfamily drug resistance transporter